MGQNHIFSNFLGSHHIISQIFLLAHSSPGHTQVMPMPQPLHLLPPPTTRLQQALETPPALLQQVLWALLLTSTALQV